MHTELLLRKIYQLAHEGKLSRNGTPGILQLAVMAKELRTETYITSLPAWVQKFGYQVLGTIGQLIGYTSRLH